MRVILHIGSNKTGTTSLQGAFHGGRRALLQAGVLYPQPTDGGHTHAVLLQGLYHPAHIPRLERQYPKSPQARVQFLETLRREVQASRPRVLVLSSEGFFRPLAPGALPCLRDELLGLGATSIEIAVYLRRPSDKYLSSLQQTLKASSQFLPPGPSTYREVLEPYLETFGTGAMRARVFGRDRLIGGDIIEDFLEQIIGGEARVMVGALPRVQANATLGAESMDILRLFRTEFHPRNDGRFAADSNALVRTLLDLDIRLGATRPRLFPEVAAAIDAASIRDLEWVEARLGLSLGPVSKSVYSLPIAPALTDLVVIDFKLRHLLLKSLAATAWALRPGWEAPRFWMRGGPLLPRRNWALRLSQATSTFAQ